jgi:hypothetical protein
MNSTSILLEQKARFAETQRSIPPAPVDPDLVRLIELVERMSGRLSGG